MKRKRSINFQNTGFTLTEIMIGIALLVALSAFVYVSINSKVRFEEARNQQRYSDVYLLMQAIMLHKSENNGALMNQISSLDRQRYYQIGSGSGCSENCQSPSVTLENNCVDLSSLKTEGYIPELPIDPHSQSASLEKTKYYLSLSSSNILTIGACLPELGASTSPPEILISK